jgi:hypothetical protein
MEKDFAKMKNGEPTWLEPDSDPTRVRMKHYFPLDKFDSPD